jgi:hypothetical protein
VNVFQTLLAVFVIAVCVLLFARLWLSPRLRAKVDSAARRSFWRVRHDVVHAWRWPASRRKAARIADAAIRRARESRIDGTWDGNVYKPKSFKRPRKPH